MDFFKHLFGIIIAGPIVEKRAGSDTLKWALYF